MLKTDNFGFNIVEGSDIVDLEGFYNPNFQLLDTTLKTIEQTGVIFTESITKTGTVYTLDKEGLTPLFMFLAPSTYIAGDTFVINGTTFSEVYGADGSYLPERGFVTGAVVLAAIQNNRLTCYAAISGSSTPGPDPEGFMQTSDYVGESATGVVHRAESAAAADTATNATNATHADTADRATNADNATKAATATLAETATVAQDATKLGSVAASGYVKATDIFGSSATKNVNNANNLGGAAASEYMKVNVYAIGVSSTAPPVSLAYGIKTGTAGSYIPGTKIVQSYDTTQGLILQIVSSLPTTKDSKVIYFVKE